MSKIPFNTSNSELPIQLRKRPDLQIAEVVYRGEPHWVAKEPLELKYHHLNIQEHAVLEWLSEPISFDQLKETFERRFAPDRVTLRELQNFLVSLHEKSLLSADGYDQGYHLLERRKENHRKEWLQKLKNFFAIRWKGFDPEWILGRLDPFVGWFFSKYAVACNATFITIAILWGLVHFQEIQSKLPGFQEFFSPDNWLRLFVLTSLLKLCHEFGHGLSFKRFGGECHEIGVMILFFTPTLYCDTSDSWMLPNKWHRAAVGLAGIYVELFTFAVATVVWWLNENETIEMISLQVMFLCSMSTTLINGNPLIKYDGYYVLSDLAEVPNLAQRAGDVVKTLTMRYGFGMKNEHIKWADRDIVGWLALYSFAAFFYRIFMTLSICWFLSQMLGRFGLSQVALGLAIFSVIGLVWAPSWSLIKRLKQPGTSLQMKPKVAFLFLAGAITLITAVLMIPFPASIECRFTTKMQNERIVYVPEDGVLQELYVREGDYVAEGDLIATLRNSKLKVECMRKQQELQSVEIEYESASRGIQDRPISKTNLSMLSDRLMDLREAVALLQTRLDSLTVRASRAGTVCSLPSHPSKGDLNDELQSFSDTLLNPKNEGTFVNRGMELLKIGDPGTVNATLRLGQQDAQLVQPKMNVTLMSESDTSRRRIGTVSTISVSRTKPDELPASLGQEEMPPPESSANSEGGSGSVGDNAQPDYELMQHRYFQAVVSIDDDTDEWVIGTRGWASVDIGYHSLGWRLRRWVLNNLRINF